MTDDARPGGYLAQVIKQRDEARADRDAFAAGMPLICSDGRHAAKVRGLDALLAAGQNATTHWEEAYAREVMAHGATGLALSAAEAQIAGVRALHQRDDSNPLGPWCDTCLCKWPCRTIVALGGHAEQSNCCVCGANGAIYFNHLDLAFCPACADCQCGQDPCTRTGGPNAESAADLHARSAHPGWEYATTEGPRKQWDDVDVPPEGAGWTRNVDKGRDGWERWDYTEESYWRRPIPVDGSS